MSDQAEEQSLEERMLQVLDAEEEQPEEELEAADETPNEEDDQEVEGEEESEEEEPQSTVKLKVNGEEIEKPLEEVISLAQQGIDYTQKTQKLAEERREVENYAQTIKVQEQKFSEHVQMQQALIDDLAQVRAIDQQIAQYEALDWNQLSDNDPVEAQKLFFTYQKLQGTRNQAAQSLAQKQQQLQQNHHHVLQERIQQGYEQLVKDMPEWSNEKAAELRAVGKEYGFSDEELSQVYDPRTIKVLHDAAQWKKLQSNPSVKNKVSQAKPVVKPGAKDGKQQANTQNRQLRDQLRKSGDERLAAKLIERML